MDVGAARPPVARAECVLTSSAPDRLMRLDVCCRRAVAFARQHWVGLRKRFRTALGVASRADCPLSGLSAADEGRGTQTDPISPLGLRTSLTSARAAE